MLLSMAASRKSCLQAGKWRQRICRSRSHLSPRRGFLLGLRTRIDYFSYFVVLFLAGVWAVGTLLFVEVWAVDTLLIAFVVAVVTGLVAAAVASETFCADVAAALSAAELTCDSEVCTPLSTAQLTVSPKPSTVLWAVPFSLSLNDENTPPFGCCWLGAGAAVEEV